ncbi:flagellar biosynthetic protein FliO [bacterium]|nr:flagellar biosynthetic protein FliO [bacterium]
MLQRSPYHQPNPKHVFTFAFVSIVVLMLPLFWSPLHNQGIGQTFPVGSPTPVSSPVTGAQLPAPRSSPALTGSAPLQAGGQPDPQPTTVVAVDPHPAVTKISLPPAQAREPAVVRPTQDPTIDFSYHLRRVVFSLLLIIVMIGVTLKMLQKFLPGMAGSKSTPGSFLNILAREAVGPSQSLALVKVGPKVLLVGLSEQSMTTLCEFSEADLAALLPASPQAAEPVDPATSKNLYGDVLRHYLSIVPGMGAKK